MNSLQWMEKRHSVRSYNGQPLNKIQKSQLETKIDEINQESGQDFQLLVDEPRAFSGSMGKYGQFSGVVNYIALVGDDEIKLGYYGEELVHFCTVHDLKTCWVGLTYKKEKNRITIPAGMKLFGVIAVGEADTEGHIRPLRSVGQLMSESDAPLPDWFLRGMEGVRLAPSALNQQKYRFSYLDGKPGVSRGIGFYTGLDLGIAMYHFDQASGNGWFHP